MSNQKIRSELEQKLQAWNVDHPEVDIVLEGESYIKADNSFLETFLLPNVTRDVTVDGKRQRYVGIFQINIWVKDNVGTGPADRLADSLIAYFPIVPKTGRVSVEKTPWAAKPILEDGWRVVPLTIQYRYES